MTVGGSTVLRRLFLVVLLGSLLASVGLVSPVSAHDSTSESIVLEVTDQRIMATAAVPFGELGYEDTSGDGLLDTTELEAQTSEVASTIVATVRSKVTLSVDGENLLITGAGVPGLGEASDDAAGSEFVALVFVTGPHDGDVGEVSLGWAFESPSSAVLLSHPDGVVAGVLGDDDTVTFSLGTAASLASFFALGIDHIRFGPDHLLFLVVLTLAVAGTTITSATTWRTVKLVTAFTVGHAISLCLAYFELVSVPAGLVEPAIALSIVAAAVLAIRGRSDEARPSIAGLIVLIHGLGFASSLASLGVATSQRATALAAFNVGIDVAQTAVVLLIVLALWVFSKAMADRMVWVRIPTAAIAAVIGLAWTVSRLSAVAI